jgi:hypothetical protein
MKFILIVHDITYILSLIKYAYLINDNNIHAYVLFRCCTRVEAKRIILNLRKRWHKYHLLLFGYRFATPLKNPAVLYQSATLRSDLKYAHE